MMKKKYIFLLVLVAAFAGFYYLTPSFESIVKQVVHKYGSAVTGTDVNLEGFNLKECHGARRHLCQSKYQKPYAGHHCN